jgi:hypothetical protein
MQPLPIGKQSLQSKKIQVGQSKRNNGLIPCVLLDFLRPNNNRAVEIGAVTYTPLRYALLCSSNCIRDNVLRRHVLSYLDGLAAHHPLGGDP